MSNDPIINLEFGFRICGIDFEFGILKFGILGVLTFGIVLLKFGTIGILQATEEPNLINSEILFA